MTIYQKISQTSGDLSENEKIYKENQDHYEDELNESVMSVKSVKSEV